MAKPNPGIFSVDFHEFFMRVFSISNGGGGELADLSLTFPIE